MYTHLESIWYWAEPSEKWKLERTKHDTYFRAALQNNFLFHHGQGKKQQSSTLRNHSTYWFWVCCSKTADFSSLLSRILWRENEGCCTTFSLWDIITHKTSTLVRTLKQIPQIVLVKSTQYKNTPPNSEIICVKNVGTKVVCGIIFFWLKENYAENMEKIVGAV